MTVDVDAGKKAEDRPGYVAQLQATLDVIPAHTWYASPSGGLTFVNKRTADYLGLPKDHPLRFGIDVGAKWDAHLPFVHPDDREETQQNWSTRLRTGEGGEGSFRVRDAQGGYRWFLSRAEPLRASDGAILHWVGVNLDIEERKCAEQALRESEYKLRQIIDTVPGHLWSANPTFEPTHLNRHLLDYFGRRFEDFREGGWEAFLHPDDLPETAKAISHAVQTGTYFQVMHRLRREDGEFRWHHARGEPLRDQQGRIIQWYGLSVDIDEAKKNEDRLRRSEAYLAEAQRLSHCGVTAYKGMTVFYGSEEIYRIWGFDPAQGVPSRKAVLQRIHPDDRDRLNAEVERALGEKRRYSAAYRIVLPDGTVKHLESIGQPVFSTKGELVEVVATQIDVTERKRAEEALRESEAKFRDYAETASDWFWEIGPDYKFTLLTENAFGAPAAHWLGTACWDHALDLETEPEKWRLFRATLDSRKPFRDLVYRGLSSNGSPMYVKASGKPVFDANGEFHGYRGTGTDMTALLRAQEQQTAISEVLRAIANSPHDLQPIFDAILDSATRLCHADSGALRLSEEGGLRLVAVRGDPFLVSQVWSSIPVLAEKGSLPDRLAASRLPTHIADFTAVEGDHRDDFLISVVNAGIRTGLFVPLLKDDEIVGLISLARKQVQPFTDNQISLFRDFAAQATIALESTRLERQYREAQMALAHANRVATMGQLTASITHEVNQPITAAVTYALAARRFLSAEPPNFREVDDALSLIVKEGNRAGEVVGRVRALIKKAPARKDAVEINDAILEIVALTRREAANNNVSVRTQLAEGLPRVQGDRVQLQQVLLNLIINAIEAMRDVGAEERELLISSRNEPAGVSVEVRDSGPGFAPAALERVFEAFYTTKPGGLGLGLSICRSIIEAHNGRLWASPNVPRGAIFGFIAPALPAATS
jgi:PAS domain S-box-containing protein